MDHRALTQIALVRRLKWPQLDDTLWRDPRWCAYVSGCETRFGPIPSARKLTFPLIRWLSRSSARSQACAWLCFILMSELPHQLLCTRVHATAHWDGVTFAETLDMATGHFRSREFEADEDAADFLLFQQFEDHADE